MTYPRNDLDDYSVLHRQLGSYWYRTYDNQLQIKTWMDSTARMYQQAALDLNALGLSSSRFTIPSFRTQLYMPLVIKLSERASTGVYVPRYGDAIVYGPQPDTGYTYRYGVGVEYGPWSYPQSSFRQAGMCVNSLTNPTIIWVEGIDFTVTDDAIVFRVDPFSRSEFTKLETDDEQLRLWFLDCEVDERWVQKQYGEVAGLDGDSSDAYRRLVNAKWDLFTAGPTFDGVSEYIAATFDIPLAYSDEVVEATGTATSYKWIATDKRVYKHALAVDPVVAVGDRVSSGSALTEGLSITALNRGRVPDSLQALVLSKSYLTVGYTAGVSFRNADVTLSVDSTTGQVRFEVGGYPSDVERFWTEYYSRCDAAGVDGAAVIQSAASKNTINPLEFLVENVLRYNFIIAQVDFNARGPDAFDATYIDQIRSLLPPFAALIVVYEVGFGTEELSKDRITDGLEFQAIITLTDSLVASEHIADANVG